MTLLQVIRVIEIVAGKQPSVNSIVRENVFRLNDTPGVKYGVFSWSQGTHSDTASGNVRTYRFTFFYVDRLTQEGGNAVECQSVGVDTLGNVIRELAEVFGVADWNIDTFRDRFADECAGAYCSVSLQVPAGACFEDFPTELPGDFNNDFNNDFLRWRHKEVRIIR